MTVDSAQAFVAELSDRTAIVTCARDVFDAASTRVSTETVFTSADRLVVLGNADCVHATLCVALTGVNTLVPNADVSAATFLVVCALHKLTTNLGIASVTRLASAHSPVVDRAAVGINATSSWIFTQVSAVGGSLDVNAG